METLVTIKEYNAARGVGVYVLPDGTNVEYRYTDCNESKAIFDNEAVLRDGVLFTVDRPRVGLSMAMR